MEEKIARIQEIYNRGLQDKLPTEKRMIAEEVIRRGLVKIDIPKKDTIERPEITEEQKRPRTRLEQLQALRQEPLVAGTEQLGRGIIQSTGKYGENIIKGIVKKLRPELSEEIEGINLQELIAEQEKEQLSEEAEKGIGYKIAKATPSALAFAPLSAVPGGMAQAGLEAKPEVLTTEQRLEEAAKGGITAGLTSALFKGVGLAGKGAFKGIKKLFNVNPAVVKEYAEAGLQPTLGEVSETGAIRRMQKFLEKTPGSSGRLEKARKTTEEAIETQLQKISKVPFATTKQTAGEVIQTGGMRYIDRFNNISNKLYNKLDDYVKPEELVNISDTLNLAKSRIQKFSETPELMETISKSAGGTQLQRMSRDAIDGKLPYKALKKYRTIIGKEIGDKFKIGDSDRAFLKELYGSLSDDIERAFSTKGDKALNSFKRANTFYKEGIQKIESNLTKVINSKVPEKVYQQAISGTKIGGTKIRSLLKGLSLEEKEIVRSQVIRDLGFRDATGNFSPAKFFTEFNKISPEAKKALFSTEQRASLDNISKVISRIKKLDASGNFSNTTTMAVSGMVGLGFLTNPTSTVQALAGANISARLMTSPKFINWLAGIEKIKTPAGLERHLKVLSQISAKNKTLRDDIYNYISSLNKDNTEVEE